MRDLNAMAGGILNTRILITDSLMKEVHLGAHSRFRREPGERELRLMARHLINEYRYALAPARGPYTMRVNFEPERTHRVVVIPFADYSIFASPGEFKGGTA